MNQLLVIDWNIDRCVRFVQVVTIHRAEKLLMIELLINCKLFKASQIFKLQNAFECYNFWALNA